MPNFTGRKLEGIFEKCITQHCRGVFLWRAKKLDGKNSNLHVYLRLSN